jgi:hypothetical protein
MARNLLVYASNKRLIAGNNKAGVLIEISINENYKNEQ